MTDLATLLDAPDPDETPTDDTPRKKLNFLPATTGGAPKEYALVPPGTYQGTIVLDGQPKADYSSKANLRVAFPVQFEVDGATRQLWADFYHTENSMWRVANFLWSAGWSADELYADQDLDDPDDLDKYLTLMGDRLPGQSVTLSVVHETWEGKTKAKIKTIKALVQRGKLPDPPRPDTPAEDTEIGF